MIERVLHPTFGQLEEFLTDPIVSDAVMASCRATLRDSNVLQFLAPRLQHAIDAAKQRRYEGGPPIAYDPAAAIGENALEAYRTMYSVLSEKNTRLVQPRMIHEEAVPFTGTPALA